MSIQKKDYVEVIYNETERPYTSYPDQLTRYLVDRYSLTENQKILDLGCGRGEFLKGFNNCGLLGHGVDQSSMAKALCPSSEIRSANLEVDAIPFEDETFDVVYSKSFLEHFYYPEKLVTEIFRVLKPGGKVITLVPDWEVVFKTFYEDYTHRTPFTQTSLKDIFVIHGFESVNSEKFYQLPYLWEKPWLLLSTKLFALLAPSSLRSHSKLVRFSQEVMLLSSAIKPKQ